MAPSEESTSSTKKCPFCAEEILFEAKKCRYCGEFLELKDRERKEKRLRRVVAVTGSLFLVIAPFAPFISAPILGRITLFQQGKGDGVILLLLGLIALGLSSFGRYGVLWFSGALGLFEIGNLFYFFYNRLPDAIENYKRQFGNNVFGSIGEITLSNVDPDWGAAVLLIGTFLSLGAAISAGITRRSITLTAKIGIVIVVLVIIWRVLLFYFPYLAYWRSLLP